VSRALSSKTSKKRKKKEKKKKKEKISPEDSISGLGARKNLSLSISAGGVIFRHIC